MTLLLVFLGGMAFGAGVVIALFNWPGGSQEESSPPAWVGHEGRWLWSYGGAVPPNGHEPTFAELAEEMNEKIRGRESHRPLHLIEGGEDAEDE